MNIDVARAAGTKFRGAAAENRYAVKIAMKCRRGSHDARVRNRRVEQDSTTMHRFPVSVVRGKGSQAAAFLFRAWAQPYQARCDS